jgi:hypothetical protein
MIRSNYIHLMHLGDSQLSNRADGLIIKTGGALCLALPKPAEAHFLIIELRLASGHRHFVLKGLSMQWTKPNWANAGVCGCGCRYRNTSFTPNRAKPCAIASLVCRCRGKALHESILCCRLSSVTSERQKRTPLRRSNDSGAKSGGCEDGCVMRRPP